MWEINSSALHERRLKVLYSTFEPLIQLTSSTDFSKNLSRERFWKKTLKNLIPKFADVIIFWQVSRYMKFLFSIGCSNHENSFYIWLILFLLIQPYLWINFFRTVICVFYRSDLCIPKWVISGQKIELNLVT